MANSSVRDFTAGAPQDTPLSPVSPSHGRRASVKSKDSVNSDGFLRNRRLTRSNTVTAYREPQHPNWQPGAEPGIDPAAQDENTPPHLADLKAQVEIRITDFSESSCLESMADNDNIESFLESPRPEELPCRWISVNGLSWDVIKLIGNKYNLHRLAIEDLIHTHTRTKVDWYADHAFIVLTLQKLVRLHQHAGSDENCDCNASSESSEEMNEKTQEPAKPRRPWWRRSKPKRVDVLPRYLDKDRDGKVDEFIRAHSGLSEESPIKPIRTLHRYESSQVPSQVAWMERHSALANEDLAVSVEQVSIFLLADNTVISFFEQSAEDVEDPIMERLRSQETILRRSVDASLLTQAIIDAIVDLAVPVRDAYNKSRKVLQIDALTNANVKTSRALHIFGEEVDMLQNLFKPIVHLVNALRDHNPDPAITAQATHDGPNPTNNQSASHAKGRPKGRRDGDGFPVMSRNLSEFQRINLRRTNTATSVVITPLAHTYFGDVFDHCVTMIAALEQMDASANNISALIFNTVSARTNNFMMILAVVTVFFAPLTFISGYFGMNFASGSGLAHPFGFFWIVAIPSLVGFMLIVFATMLWDQIKDIWERRGAHGKFGGRRRRR